ncbi:multicopper oxidase family protein [Actinacidiphila bryophytorum]|uniref:Multicopper oxidase with three cupredoxin domains (Includes cell division protein FtsP and spore coat protein CotA) n=1 Tax=Actinacidiphila bryophytorum TaxID=1436133 RepID=A0A9W4H750_9ACTN|nr:multicopper oxidase family protein [Actinacidiphila bryophytorum]MBM9437815.1 multicopper oxidase family protein [Actinacidiphila bryophytorum]MBN6547152.1 multicopper oxidase family protein [Actinacidiphila bryophytorum]CAG7657053.1 Multicopper oxidase with three cupredoxin domains (Includes cell division protein FtsP and spore coat protein CotA) [Actinacidiphila bryophytorum]
MPHGPSRRSLLTAGGVGLGAAALGAFGAPRPQQADAAASLTFASPQLTPYVDELPVAPVLTGDRTITTAASTHRFHRDLGVAKTWSYGGQPYQGPTIEAHRGEPLTLTFSNAIDGGHLFAADVDPTLQGASELDRTQPRTTVHIHGAVTPPEADGHPEDTVRPGGTMTYRHPNGQDAAHLWYHDHAMGITRLNAVAGLAGTYLLRDEYDTGTAANRLGLPSGEFEVPLTLADRRFLADGSLNFRTAREVPQGHWEGGMFGDLMTVNGIVSPYLKVARGFYRFRVLNASNARGYRLFFSNQMPFWVVGTDGGLLDAPARTTSVRLAPGERLDLVVDFGSLAAGDHVDLTNDQQESPEVVAATAVVPTADILRFVGTGARGFTTPPPTVLRGAAGLPAALPALPAAGTLPRRIVTLTPATAPGWPPAGMMMNNLRYGDGPVLTPRQGTAEVWEFVNASSEPHPMHLHLVHMRILDRQVFDAAAYRKANPRPEPGTAWSPSPDAHLLGTAQPPQAWEAGVKDTVGCPPGMVTRVLVRFPAAAELGFDPDASFAAMDGMRLRGYVWHCHILDHEDDCMMARYRIGT